ncbi:MAG: hypothetical protein WCD20_05230 [Rhodomicrobium sp.]
MMNVQSHTISLCDKIALLRDAIKNKKQVIALGRKLERVFCPHILGTRNGTWYVVVWQFEGFSNMGDLPNWRAFDLREIEEIVLRDGPWQTGKLRRGRENRYVDSIDTAADLDYSAKISKNALWQFF